MRIPYPALLIFFLFLTGCTESSRLSLEGGTTSDLFTFSDRYAPYGSQGRDGMVTLTTIPVAEIPELELGMSVVRWSGPYTENTMVGANFGYCLVNDKGYFVRASIGPYYGDETVRTGTPWTFGIKGSVGKQFNKGKNDFYVGYRHFSNGSDLGLGQEPNMGEEFLNCGVSFLF